MKRFLRALACTGLLGAVAAVAQAQARVFVGVRAPLHRDVLVAAPPCPGVGYVWVPGYYMGAIWYPGRWIFRGYAYDHDRGYGYDHDRPYIVRDRDRAYVDRGYRDRDRDRDRDFRGRDVR